MTNNNIKIVTKYFGEFEGTFPKFYDSGICIKPTSTLKCIMELAGICAAEQKNGTDPNEMMYIDSEPVRIIESDGKEHEYKIRVGCIVGNGAYLNSYALIMFIYTQKFIFQKFESEDKIAFSGDWKAGHYICEPPVELLDKVAGKKQQNKVKSRRESIWKQMLILFRMFRIQLIRDNKFIPENGYGMPLWIAESDGVQTICAGQIYLFDLFVMTRNFKKLTPNFLNQHKSKLRLAVLSLNLELNEPYGKYREGFISLSKAVGSYAPYPSNKDRSKLLRKERVINDLIEIRESDLFSRLKCRYEDTEYNLDDLQNKELIENMDLNQLQISYEINRDKRYNITLQDRKEKTEKKTRKKNTEETIYTVGSYKL